MKKKKRLTDKQAQAYASWVLKRIEYAGKDINELYRQDRDNVIDLREGEMEIINKIVDDGYISGNYTKCLNPFHCEPIPMYNENYRMGIMEQMLLEEYNRWFD